VPELAWYDPTNERFIPGGTILRNGKTVVLQGNGYGRQLPKRFALNRVPSRFVSWTFSRLHRRIGKNVLNPGIFPNPARQSPPTVIETSNIALGNAGDLHTHRWQFTTSTYKSPIVRTARTAGIALKNTTTTPPVHSLPKNEIELRGTISTPVDPNIRIESVFPWSDTQSFRLSEMLRTELSSLPSMANYYELAFYGEEFGRHDDPSKPIRLIGLDSNGVEVQLIPEELAMSEEEADSWIDEVLSSDVGTLLTQSRPRGIEVDFDGYEGFLGEGESAEFSVRLRVPNDAGPIPLAFGIVDIETGEPIGDSEIVLVMGDNVFFCEG